MFGYQRFAPLALLRGTNVKLKWISDKHPHGPSPLMTSVQFRIKAIYQSRFCPI